MVKRAKSPDATDDARYMTVYQPYPMNANWELPSDVILFAFWIAGCIGVEPLLGLHYKPKARGMVLLEIDKAYPEHERLLGEHRWKEFLKKPREDEKERISQIFYCLYDTGRAAQKDGWKRIHVESYWFKEWSPNNPMVHKPYPQTYWCPVPPEDKTNKPLCRPLPVAVKPPPAKPAPPVVGSSTYSEMKNGPNPNNPNVLSQTWAKGRATQSVKVPDVAWDKPIMNNDKPNTPKSASPSTSGGGKSAWATSPSTSKESAWGPPLPGGTTPTSAKPPNSAWGPTAPRSGNVWVKPNGASKPNTPITATPGPNTPTTTAAEPGWDQPAAAPTKTKKSVPPRSPKPNQTSTPSANPVERLKEGEVMISLSPSQEKYLYGLGAEEEEDVLDMDPEQMELAYVAPWEREVATATGDLWGGTGEGDEAVDNLWGDEEPVDPTAGQLMCPSHGKLCKKGICSEMAKMVREKERKEKEGDKPAKKGRKNPRGAPTKKNTTGSSSNAGGSSNASVAEEINSAVDEDGFATARAGRGKRGARGGRGRGKVVVTAGERNAAAGGAEEGEKSTIGKMRGFNDDESVAGESVAGASENGWARPW